MPKKNFYDGVNDHPADSFFSTPQKKEKEPLENIISTPAPSSPMPIAAPVHNNNNDETTFSMTLPKKKSRGKQINVRVNDEDYAAFTEIVNNMGYNATDIFNQFISEFIKANK